MRLENRSTDCNEVIKMRQVFNLIVKMWDTLKLFWSKTNRWHRVFFIFLIVQFRFIPGGQLGFQCNDPALSYPFTGDTINMKWLFGTTLLVPLAMLLLVERMYHRNEKPTDNSKSRALRWYREYLFGLLINLTLVQTLKLIVGSPRPHFFDTCQPEEALNCHESEYVASYTCTKALWQHESDKSFPSGHTSLAVHAGIFVVYYLHQRAKQSSASRVILSIQSVCLVAALYCCISRMTDHRHHWWDVLAGATVAAPIIWFTLLSLCKNFKCFESGDCEEPGQVKNSTNHKETCDIRG
ncbi:phospholipid phosphatase 1-like [Choristoneura fumiferana]|uniref:phospholipid phosphatase 1-like n=1 Tax=Choristoneura fumiferana TaxID=7141 RepID=UPI003D1571C4